MNEDYENLTIEPKREGSKLTVVLKGEINVITSKEFDAFMNDNLEGVTELVFDIKDVAYISSAGLKVFLNAQKVMNTQGSMVILHMADEIKDSFDLTGFSKVMRIE